MESGQTAIGRRASGGHVRRISRMATEATADNTSNALPRITARSASHTGCTPTQSKAYEQPWIALNRLVAS